MSVTLFSDRPLLRRLAFLLSCILTLAGIAHIASVLLIPYISGTGFYFTRSAGTALNTTTLIDSASAAGATPRFLDPATAIATCAYNLSDQPLRVTVPTGDDILTLSFHSTDGRVYYALSDRAAQKNIIELVLMTRRQLDEALSQDEEDEAAKDVRLLSPVTAGLVVVRVLSLQQAGMKDARARAMQMRCMPESVIPEK